MNGTQNGSDFVDQALPRLVSGTVMYLTKWTFLTCLLSFGMQIPVDRSEIIIHDRML